MILHKYLDKCYNTLSDLALKVSIPSKLNDPLEMVPDYNIQLSKKSIEEHYNQNKSQFFNGLKNIGVVKSYDEFAAKDSEAINRIFTHLSDPTGKKELIRRAKDGADKYYKFISFSIELLDDVSEILMWSHYCKGHCGLRFHFDSELLNLPKDSELTQINYDTKRVSFENLLEPSLNEFKSLMLTKSKVWEYENEYRLIFRIPLNKALEDIFEKDGKEFTKFPSKSLVRIDLGVNSQVEDYIRKELEREDLNHIELYKAEIHPKEFRLDYKKIN